MNSPKFLLALLLCLLLGGGRSASAAAMADFAGFCTLDYGSSTTAYCSFSSMTDTAEADVSSCPGSSITRFDWNLGDGNGWFQDDSFVSTSYANATSLGSVTAWVKVTCADETSQETPRNVVFVTLGCYRCINMNNDWD
jgi:hypothetical protein